MKSTGTESDRQCLQDESVPMIGIVAALHLELSPFIERCETIRTQSGNGFKFRACRFTGCRVCIVEGGAGFKQARKATQGLIDGFEPDWVLSAGFSGALADHLKLGDIVVADSLADPTGESTLTIDVGMASAPESGLHVGRLCTVDHIVREIGEKRRLAERTGALAVDMESLAVAQVCRERHTKFMAIRVISDDLSTDLPPEVLAVFGPKGTVRAGALVGSLIKRPGSVKDLWALREKALHAAERLAQFLEGVIPQLTTTGT